MLTATPGKSVKELFELLGTLKRPGEPTFDEAEIMGPDGSVRRRAFAERARGIVSFYDNSGNEADFPNLRHRVILSPMLPKQQMTYIEKEQIDSDAKAFSDTAWSKLKDKEKFARRSRAYANMMFPRSRGFAAAMEQLESMASYSAKLAQLSSLLMGEARGTKSYVYSAFGQQGAIQIGQALEALGWADVTQNPFADPLPGEDGMRFMSTARWASDATALQKAAYAKSINEFNREDNDDGSRIALLIANKRYNEGLDLKAVRRVIFFEAQISMMKELQGIGRARRFCSHARLPPQDRTVEVIHMFSAFDPKTSNEISVADQLAEATGKAQELDRQAKELREQALAVRKEALRGGGIVSNMLGFLFGPPKVEDEDASE